MNSFSLRIYLSEKTDTQKVCCFMVLQMTLFLGSFQSYVVEKVVDLIMSVNLRYPVFNISVLCSVVWSLVIIGLLCFYNMIFISIRCVNL